MSPWLTVKLLLILAAFICTLMTWTSPPKMPIQVPVLLLCLFGLILTLPVK